MGPNAITLAWKPPKDDGGCRIQKYVLEKRPKGSKKWTKCPGLIGPNDTEATARNLEKGEEYEFRVMAVNEEGESDPLETDGFIKAKHPWGKSRTRAGTIPAIRLLQMMHDAHQNTGTFK